MFAYGGPLGTLLCSQIAICHDKIPEQDNSKKEKFTLTHFSPQGFQSVIGYPSCFGPVVLVKAHAVGCLAISGLHRSKRKRKHNSPKPGLHPGNLIFERFY